FLFSLKNNGGQIIGISELYSSEAGMENGIKNLKNRIASLASLGEL
ncbi:MAG: YegP family protein, partial [Maribacter sp.]